MFRCLKKWFIKYPTNIINFMTLVGYLTNYCFKPEYYVKTILTDKSEILI